MQSPRSDKLAPALVWLGLPNWRDRRHHAVDGFVHSAHRNRIFGTSSLLRADNSFRLQGPKQAFRLTQQPATLQPHPRIRAARFVLSRPVPAHPLSLWILDPGPTSGVYSKLQSGQQKKGRSWRTLFDLRRFEAVYRTHAVPLLSGCPKPDPSATHASADQICYEKNAKTVFRRPWRVTSRIVVVVHA